MLQNIVKNQEHHLFTNIFHGEGLLYENPMTNYLLELLSQENKNLCKQKNREKYCAFQRKKDMNNDIFSFHGG
jgi:hypothetical protein